jgi:hypothetical protein
MRQRKSGAAEVSGVGRSSLWRTEKTAPGDGLETGGREGK